MRSTPKKALGQRLRAFRLATHAKGRPLTQENLGKRSGLSGKFIGEVERGQKSISHASLTLVAEALEVTVPDLVNFNGDVRPVELDQIDALLVRKPPVQMKRALEMLRAAFGKRGAA